MERNQNSHYWTLERFSLRFFLYAIINHRYRRLSGRPAVRSGTGSCVVWTWVRRSRLPIPCDLLWMQIWHQGCCLSEPVFSCQDRRKLSRVEIKMLNWKVSLHFMIFSWVLTSAYREPCLPISSYFSFSSIQSASARATERNCIWFLPWRQRLHLW